MSPIRSSIRRSAAGWLLRGVLAASALVAAGPVSAAATTPMTPMLFAMQELASVRSSEFSLSREDAGIRLDLSSGRTLDIALRDGAIFIDDEHVGDAPRGSEIDRAWRELMLQAMDASNTELPALLANWSPPAGEAGALLRSAIDTALQSAADASAVEGAVGVPAADSMNRLVERIHELESTVAELESRRAPVVVQERRSGYQPFRYIAEGIGGIFSFIITYGVLFAIAFGVIFFGGRRYIEGVADTARHATGRSFLVGLAASFLVVPAFILGVIALVISVVGIPGLLVWLPGFPVAVVLAILLGYLAVAHAVGEAFAERRFYVNDWFQRGNSYYFLLSGLGILLSVFLASQIVHMAGPWFRAINAILIFVGVVSTFIAAAVGFGAVLISRAGTRPVGPDGTVQQEDMFREGIGV